MEEKHNERRERERGEEEKIRRIWKGSEKEKQKQYAEQQRPQQGKKKEEEKMEEGVEVNK